MLLEYALRSSPDPLQAAGQASFTLIVSNPERRTVTCSRIVVAIPVGDAAKDLVADADAIEARRPPGWSVGQDAGVFTFLPENGAGSIEGEGLVFDFANLQVNGEPGTAIVGIEETAALRGSPEVVGMAGLPVGKWPARLAVGDLRADPLHVAAPGKVILNWTGADDPRCTDLTRCWWKVPLPCSWS